MAKQRQADRLKRLNDGRCPVHGTWMSQVDSWYEDELGNFTLVGCPRKDCNVVAKARSVAGPWSLIDSKSYLLEQGDDGLAEVLKLPKSTPVLAVFLLATVSTPALFRMPILAC